MASISRSKVPAQGQRPRMLLGTLASVFAGSVLFSMTGFYVYTRHCRFEPMNANTEPVFQTPSYLKYNPFGHDAFYDDCVRRIPLRSVRPDLLKDAEQGGTKLVEAFTQGVYGKYGYTVQRRILQYLFRDNDRTKHQVWDKNALLTHEYPPGTQITDHFQVLDKTNETMLIRGGDSPMTEPEGPRSRDSLCYLIAHLDPDKGYAEFHFKTIMYCGVKTPASDSSSSSPPPPMEGGFIVWLHMQYTKLLVQNGVDHVQRGWS